MSIRQLQYFIALYEECHFGRAAERCHVSQPTFSMQVAKLEKFLGELLFTRNSRHVDPTDAARRIVPMAARVVDDFNKILSSTAREESITPD